MTGLGELPNVNNGYSSAAKAVSADGATLVGAPDSYAGTRAFRWTAAGGLVGLGDLRSGNGGNRALAASGDGSIIVGSADINGDTPAAFIWTEGAGMQRLVDVLLARSANVPPGWKLEQATSISADGRWVAGWARNSTGGFEAWVADLAVFQCADPLRPEAYPSPGTMSP